MGPVDTITQGAATVLINGMPAARQGDGTAHGGVIVAGASSVIIGGPTFSLNSGQCTQTGDPINVYNGEVFAEYEDAALFGPPGVAFTRSYSSVSHDCDLGLGPGWGGNFLQRIEFSQGTWVWRQANATKRLLVPLENGRSAAHPTGWYSVRNGIICVFTQGDNIIWHFKPLRPGAPVANLIAAEGMPGVMTRLEYGHNGLVQSISSPCGGTLRALTNTRRQISELRSSNTLVRRYHYSDDAHLIAVESRHECIYHYQYDRSGRMSGSGTSPDALYRFEYDQQGRCTFATGPHDFLRRSLSYQEGRTEQLDSLQSKTLFILHGPTSVEVLNKGRREPHPVALIDPIPGILERLFEQFSIREAKNGVELQHRETGQQYRLLRSSSGNIQVESLGSKEAPHSQRIILELDRHLRVSSIGGPDGLYLERDLLGRIQLLKQGTRWMKLEHSPEGWRTAESYPDGYRITYGYDSWGRPTEISDVETKLINLRYDAFGQVIGLESRDGCFTYAYDTEARPQSVGTPSGRIDFAYDDYGRLQRCRMPDESWEEYTYDEADALIRLRLRLGTTIHLRRLQQERCFVLEPEDAPQDSLRITYGQSGLPVHFEQCSATTVKLTRDSSGRVECDRQAAGEVSYRRDAKGALDAVLLDGLEIARYERDSQGRLHCIRDAGNHEHFFGMERRFEEVEFSHTLPTGEKETRYVNSVGLLRGCSGSFGWSLTRRNCRRVSEVRYADGHSVNYQYDEWGRLKDQQGLDSLPADVYRDGYARKIWIRSEEEPLDADYDVFGRLTRVRQAGRELASYLYDPLGRRSSKTVSGHTTHFVWDGLRLLAEIEGNTLARVYTYSPESSVPLSLYDAIRKQTYYYHYDHQNFPIALTDEQGATVWFARHDAFGRTAYQGRIEQPFRLPGQYYDSETGLHYNVYRYYSPRTGCYLSPDPRGLAGGWPEHLFAQGDPVQFCDPYGDIGRVVDPIPHIPPHMKEPFVIPPSPALMNADPRWVSSPYNNSKTRIPGNMDPYDGTGWVHVSGQVSLYYDAGHPSSKIYAPGQTMPIRNGPHWHIGAPTANGDLKRLPSNYGSNGHLEAGDIVMIPKPCWQPAPVLVPVPNPQPVPADEPGVDWATVGKWGLLGLVAVAAVAVSAAIILNPVPGDEAALPVIWGAVGAMAK